MEVFTTIDESQPDPTEPEEQEDGWNGEANEEDVRNTIENDEYDATQHEAETQNLPADSWPVPIMELSDKVKSFRRFVSRPYMVRRHSLHQYLIQVPEKSDFDCDEPPLVEVVYNHERWKTDERDHYRRDYPEPIPFGTVLSPKRSPRGIKRKFDQFLDNEYETSDEDIKTHRLSMRIFGRNETINNRAEESYRQYPSIGDPAIRGIGESRIEDKLHADIDQALAYRFGYSRNKIRRNSEPWSQAHSDLAQFELMEPRNMLTESRPVTRLANAWRYRKISSHRTARRDCSFFEWLMYRGFDGELADLLSLSAYHRLLRFLLYTLENACFEWMQQESPEWISALRIRDAQDIELGAWILIIKAFLGRAGSYIHLDEDLYDRVHQLRHDAVHRGQTELHPVKTTVRLLEFLNLPDITLPIAESETVLPQTTTRVEAVLAVVKVFIADYPAQPDPTLSFNFGSMNSNASNAPPDADAAEWMYEDEASIRKAAALPSRRTYRPNPTINRWRRVLNAITHLLWRKPTHTTQWDRIRKEVKSSPRYHTHPDTLLILKACSPAELTAAVRGTPVSMPPILASAKERAIAAHVLDDIESRQTVHHIHMRAQMQLEECLIDFYNRPDVNVPSSLRMEEGKELQIVAKSLRNRVGFSNFRLGSLEQRKEWLALLEEARTMRNDVAHRDFPQMNHLKAVAKLIEMCRFPRIHPELDQRLQEIEKRMLDENLRIIALNATRQRVLINEYSRMTESDWQDFWYLAQSVRSRLHHAGANKVPSAFEAVCRRLEKTGKLCMVEMGFDFENRQWPGGIEVEEDDVQWVIDCGYVDVPE